ncbi:MAG TPA: VIT domain-containing protein [Gemmatimonadales bacterium]|nr:VIT domain-containing protein [Gemmatimonadales bacterium]
MLRTGMLALTLALLAGPAQAQGWIEIERPRVPGSSTTIIRTESQVRTTIDGRIARVEVAEQFRNHGGSIAEGSYLYPLSGEAVFQNFSLWMGNQELRGEMMNADQARNIYEEIVRRQKDPALLTLAGHGLVRARVFPIQAGETRKIALRYTQLLERAGDALRLRYAVGERGRANLSFLVTVPNAGDFGQPYSPTHHITTERHGDQLEITVDTDGGSDIELFLPLRQGIVGTSVVTHAPGGEDGYLMLLLAPAMTEDGLVVPRDLSLVVDVSGSMAGAKLDQAKTALRQALGTLNSMDRFRLVSFSSGVRNFRDGWSPVTANTLGEARQFIDALQAEGGTNIAGALDAVLGTTVPEDRLPIVVFLTDGLPSVGEQEPDRIAAAAARHIGRTRIFTVGMGPDVNTYLIDRLAKEGRGSAAYVPPDASVEVAMGSLLGKIRRPALVNLRIVDSPVRLVDLSPGTLPDLFYGEELTVFGRYRGEGSGPIVIEGERNGRRERFTAQATFPTSQPANDFIPRLWASRRIGDLTRQIRLEGSSEALVREVRYLGLRYGILTEYTSYLVQEPGAVAINRRIEDAAALRAAAPAAQTGQGAFDMAKQSASLSKTSSLAEADKEENEKLMIGAALNKDIDMKRVGGRIFARRDGVWTDAGLVDSLRVIEVAPYSDAYFAVARALPELGPCLVLGDEVTIAGRSVTIRITAKGAQSLSNRDLTALVKGFRGV